MSYLDSEFEWAQLLARLKLAARRSLNRVVDLERLRTDAAYAKAELAALEDAAEDETLLVLVLRVRARLFPAAEPVAVSAPVAPLVPAPTPTPQPEIAVPRHQPTRRYTMGARGFL